MSDLTPLGTPKHPQIPPKWQLQISTIRANICQIEHVIWMLEFILADQLADLPPGRGI